MYEELLKLLFIYLLTMFKFIAGPSLGYAAGYNYLTTVAITVSGMMSSVLLFTFLGKILRDKIINRYLPKRRTFTRRSRRFVRIWRTYGEIGVAILTPLLLTPIGGTIMLTSTGTKKSKIIFYMLLSGNFWALIIAGLIYHFGDELLQCTGLSALR
jgi:hypothetical protein